VAGGDVAPQHGGFVVEVVGAGRERFVVFPDGFGVAGCAEEGVCAGFLGGGGAEEGLGWVRGGEVSVGWVGGRRWGRWWGEGGGGVVQLLLRAGSGLRGWGLGWGVCWVSLGGWWVGVCLLRPLLARVGVMYVGGRGVVVRESHGGDFRVEMHLHPPPSSTTADPTKLAPALTQLFF